MLLRYILRRTRAKQLFAQGTVCQKNPETLEMIHKHLRGIGTSVLQFKASGRRRCDPATGLKYGPILAAAASAIIQIDDDTQKQKEEDSELIRSIKLAVLSIQVCEPPSSCIS